MSPDLRRAVLALYDEVDQEVAAAGPVCLASGRCCRFKEYGHTLFLSGLEAELLLAEAPAFNAPASSAFCPFQKGNLCTARQPRPLGCRVYYCDPLYQETGNAITEKYLSRLKELSGAAWRYAPLHMFLNEKSGSQNGSPTEIQGENMASILYSDVRKGMVILHEGQLCYVVDRELRTPGNLPSKLTLKLKYLKTGNVNTERVHPSDKVEQAYLETVQMQYLYKDGDDYVFMNTENYDQTTLKNDMVGDMMVYLKENDMVKVVFYEGNPLSVELPSTVELKVTDTEPALKGATAAAQYKPATLETGLKISVPPFINIGEAINVDTRTGEYLSRAK